MANPGGKPEDLYAVLGVARGASDDEIRTAYRKLARQYHPDVNPGDAAAEERFKQISFANDVLSDAEKRRRYDEFGLEGLAEGFDPGQTRAYRRWSQGAHQSPFQEGFSRPFDLDDLFADFLGGARRDPRGPRRGVDVRADVEVDFLDLVRADEVRVAVVGKGALRVRIPRGADEGTRIRLAGQGEPGPAGGPPGDLYLTLRVRPHPFLRRDGDDLELDLPISAPEAVLGATVQVPTPQGPVQMKIPPRSQNGRRMRLRGRGAARRAEGQSGDLFVRLVVQLPETDDARLDELARELEPFYTGADLRKDLET